MGKVKQWGVEHAESEYFKLATKTIKNHDNFDSWHASMMKEYDLLKIAYPEEQYFEEMNREKWDEFYRD
jgi:hypothetical protein